MKKKSFTVSYLNKNYILEEKPGTTIFQAWIRIKDRFAPGSSVTIIDEKNNMRTFKKE